MMKIKEEINAAKMLAMNNIQEKLAKLIRDYSDAEKEAFSELDNYVKLNTNVTSHVCLAKNLDNIMDIIRDVEKKHKDQRFPEFKEFLAKVEKFSQDATENLQLTIKIGQKSFHQIIGLLPATGGLATATTAMAGIKIDPGISGEKGENNARLKT